jgi:hypothetical protein
MNAASVAKKFTFSRRRENLTFGHHQAIAALDTDEQEKLLAWCETAEQTGFAYQTCMDAAWVAGQFELS